MNFEGWYSAAGSIIGLLGAVIAFIAIWIAAVGEAGWVVGIALGWIPAYLGAALLFIVLRFLWLPALLLIAVGLTQG